MVCGINVAAIWAASKDNGVWRCWRTPRGIAPVRIANGSKKAARRALLSAASLAQPAPRRVGGGGISGGAACRALRSKGGATYAGDRAKWHQYRRIAWRNGDVSRSGATLAKKSRRGRKRNGNDEA